MSIIQQNKTKNKVDL